MAKILRLSDRLKFKVGSVEFIITPLSNDRKLELAQCMRFQGGEQEYDLLKAQHLYVKYGLKEIKGVEDTNDQPYELEFEGDCLTDDCVSEVFYLQEKTLFLTAAWQILNGMTDNLVDVVTGKKLKGVELKVEKSGKK